MKEEMDCPKCNGRMVKWLEPIKVLIGYEKGKGKFARHETFRCTKCLNIEFENWPPTYLLREGKFNNNAK